MAKTTPHNSIYTGPLAKLRTVLPYVLVIGGIIGCIASTMITVEKFQLLQNPHQQFICDLNPIISCGNVMASKQAHAFGFTNTYIGLLGFPVLLTVGMTMFAGAKFKRWFWISMQIGLTLGMIFAYWLLWQSIYRIRALCPYCLSIDVALTAVWWYVTLWNFFYGFIKVPTWAKSTGQLVKRHHIDILAFWYLIVIVVILQHFWYYFGPHLFHLGQ